MPLKKQKKNKTLFSNLFTADKLATDLSQQALKFLSKKKRIINFDENYVVFKEGSSPKGIYILIQGQVQLNLYCFSGEKPYSHSLKKHEIVGLTEILANIKNESTLKTITPCVFEFIPRKDFIDLLQNESTVCFNLVKILSLELRKSYQLLCSISI